MVFNAVCGNDDDHVRNHAVVYRAQERRWRLAPAYDVIPNPVETPKRLHMQLSLGRFDISREAVLADAHRFGLLNRVDASDYLERLLQRIVSGFDLVQSLLDEKWKDEMAERLRYNVARLRAGETGR